MVKVVNSFKGKTTEELQKLPNDELFALLNSRQRRSLKRGLSDNKKKLIAEIKEAKEGKNKNPIKTHQRDLIILPYMIGTTINVFDGKEFKPIGIGAEMVGHYIGEYAITNKRVNHGAPGVGASRSSLYVPLKWLKWQDTVTRFKVLMQQSMLELQFVKKRFHINMQEKQQKQSKDWHLKKPEITC